MEKIKIEILPNLFLNEDGTFNKNDAMNLSGKIAGVCYDKEGFNNLKNEPKEKTIKRINLTLNNGHHSVYDHIMINLNIQNIPKILAMVLNNEKQYTTSEKSARYTPVVKSNNSVITDREEFLYNKWLNIFNIKIKEEYSNIYNDSKIKKLSLENARYLVTVFMPTQMIYSTTLRQINYISSWMREYIKNINLDNSFEIKLANSMQDFINELERLNVLDDKLMINEKFRKLSLFGKNLENKKDYFGSVYSCLYKGTFSQLAQAQRHRTINYQMQFLNNKEYFVPPILLDDQKLVDEWLNDINSISDVIPQGQLILISEEGTYDNFILKCKERLCSSAQLEIMSQTKKTLLKYKDELENSNDYLFNDIKQYTNGARCTFPDFQCLSDCKFAEGKKLSRKI